MTSQISTQASYQFVKLANLYNQEKSEQVIDLRNDHLNKIANCYANVINNHKIFLESNGKQISEDTLKELAGDFLIDIINQLNMTNIDGPNYEECFSKIESLFLPTIGLFPNPDLSESENIHTEINKEPTSKDETPKTTIQEKFKSLFNSFRNPNKQKLNYSNTSIQ